MSFTSHAQPEPNWPAPAAENSSLNLSTEPKLSVIAFSSSPGMATLSGDIISQNWLWFQYCEALLKMPDCATALGSYVPLMISSTDLPSHSVPAIALLPLST